MYPAVHVPEQLPFRISNSRFFRLLFNSIDIFWPDFCISFFFFLIVVDVSVERNFLYLYLYLGTLISNIFSIMILDSFYDITELDIKERKKKIVPWNESQSVQSFFVYWPILRSTIIVLFAAFDPAWFYFWWVSEFFVVVAHIPCNVQRIFPFLLSFIVPNCKHYNFN